MRLRREAISDANRHVDCYLLLHPPSFSSPFPMRIPPMKRIEAIIPYDLIQEVETALIHSGMEGLTLSSVYSQTMPDRPSVSRAKRSAVGIALLQTRVVGLR